MSTTSLVDQVDDFQLGLATLAEVLGSLAGGVSPNEIKYVWKQMRPFFSQAFLVRTVAHYFFLLASDVGVGSLIERSARLDYAGGTKVMIQ